MALFHITIEKVVVKSNDELLQAINDKLDRLLDKDDAVLKKAATDLDTSTDALQETINQTSPSLKK